MADTDTWLQRILEEAEQALLSESEKSLLNQNDSLDVEVHTGFLDTLYFGGGTPSALSDEQLAHLTRVFRPWMRPGYEWTMEINPETVDTARLQYIRSLGINRLSIGIQSFHDDSLRRMNRHHTAACAMAVTEQARQAGFTNISADLIYGLPWTDMEDVRQDLECFLQLDLPHLSIYSLQIEDNSLFGKQHLQPIDEDLEADMYEYICQTLKRHGYEHYEISSFCKSGYQSRHNMAYWQDAPYLGIGWGACGYDENGYYAHSGTLQQYLEQGPVLEYEKDTEPAFAAIMMGLRTASGLDTLAWQDKYNRSFHDFDPVLQQYAQFLEMDNGRLYVNEKGMEILNTILVEFLEQF